MAPTPGRLSLDLLPAAAWAALAFLTLLWRDWIEIVFHVDPDGRNGSLEWLLVGMLMAACAAFLIRAWRLSQVVL
jgi:hypothetical protein